jgi:FAD/FMN-containing dehydrogenase
MNKIISVNDVDMTAKVEAGVKREQLNQYLRDKGMFFSVDPGANASIGGMAATRASGTNTVCYGTMADVTLAAEVVLANGEVIHVGTEARKSSMGLDIIKLFVGSEGTLGIMTTLTVKLYPIPESSASGICEFNTIADAVDIVVEARKLRIQLARCELLDELAVKACNTYSKLNLSVKPHLFVELHGNKEAIQYQIDEFSELCESKSGRLEYSFVLEERSRLWKARHDAWWAFHSYFPGQKGTPTDVCVPLQNLAECILQTKIDVKKHKLDAPLVGHVGDGNFHLLIMTDEQDTSASSNVDEFLEKLYARALEFGGTISGEHGVGEGKISWMKRQHLLGADLMENIKLSIDPKNIMNPSKMLPGLL